MIDPAVRALDQAVRSRVLLACLVALFVAWSALCGAAGHGPVFRTIGVSEGLPDNSIEGVVEDRWGFIWIATPGGLVRHEGQKLRVVPSGPAREGALPGSNIMALAAGKSGPVWASIKDFGLTEVGPDLGVRRHVKTESLGGILPDDNIWAITEDCSGRLWLAFMQAGVGVYDPGTERFEMFEQGGDHGLNRAGMQLNLSVDSLCRLWVVQTSQVSVFDDSEAVFRPVWKTRERSFSYYAKEIAGRVYLNEGGQLYDLGPVETAADDSHRPEAIADVVGIITGIAGDPQTGEIVFTSSSGLYRLKPDQPDSIRRVGHHPGLAGSLPSETLNSLMFDSENGLWLGSTQAGVAYQPPGWTAFERYHAVDTDDQPGLPVDPVTSMAVDDQAGGLWLGGMLGATGFLRLDQGDGAVPVLSEQTQALFKSSNIVGMWREGNDLYILSQTRLVKTRPDSDEPPVVLREREGVDDGTHAWAQRRDEHSIWLATRDAGLLLIDERDGAVKAFSPAGEGPLHLPENSPGSLVQKTDGSWWLAAPGGVYRYSERRGFVAFQTDSGLAPNAAVWANGSLWVAGDDGLERWDATADNGFEVGMSTQFDDRIAPGRTLDLFAGSGDDLWLVRTSGLFRYQPESGRWHQVDTHTGLAPIDYGSEGAVLVQDGRLFLGGGGGVAIVSLDRLKPTAHAPYTYITRVQARDNIVDLVPGESRGIVLEYSQNDIAIDYLASSYLDPEKTRYQVRLEGWEEDWVTLTGQTRRHYTNLPAGHYRFVARSAAPDGPWSVDEASLMIVVRQPPWLSAWAMAGYATLAVIGLLLVWGSYRRGEKRRRAMREALQKRALAEQQRKIMARLNRNLEPQALGRVVAAEFCEVAGGEGAWFKYMADGLGGEIIASRADMPALEAVQWPQRFTSPGASEMTARLIVGAREVAQVIVAGMEKQPDLETRERLRLLEDMVSQTLHNTLLLQRVRSLARQADEANRAKSEFLATMSHEIRTPLHGLLGMVELLGEQEGGHDRQALLDTLTYSGHQLQRIIDDVLDLSRIEAGRIAFDIQPFELPAMLEQVVDLHAPGAARRNLDLRLRMSASLPPVAVGDAGRISQVLGNLLSNAVKFTPQGGVEVAASVSADGQLVLTVADSGPGISAGDRARLFQPFTQLDASITRTHSGSGLGLAICRRLVHAMDGTLSLVDSRFGGACFRVTLPVIEPAGLRLEQPLTSMLEQTVVAARLGPPTLRALRWLARRWGFAVVDARRAAPRAVDLFLADGHDAPDGPKAENRRWTELAGHSAWLVRPQQDWAPGPGAGTALRWPLVESRLVGLLLELAWAETDTEGSTK